MKVKCNYRRYYLNVAMLSFSNPGKVMNESVISKEFHAKLNLSRVYHLLVYRASELKIVQLI